MEPTEGQVSQLDFPSTLGFMKGSEEETSPVASDELFLTAIMRAPFPENAVGRQNNPTCEDSCVIGVEVPIQDSAGSSNLHDDKFLELTSDVFLDFLSADDLVVDSELEVFKALLKWGVHNLKQQSKEITTVNMRNIMSSLIQAIRFPNMSKSEIINYVLPLELLLPEQTTWLKDWCNRSTENAQEEEETMFSSKPRTQYTDQEDVPGSNVAL
ncbi:unnamed protein product [Allacma fusca]|uniref:BACK domain-containing protein n=1 Tax=Allacma fusca TaxID=39272 RepID=A0A8J2NW93_9HEXA|nr:unnamed protein product [Allacma fusca]